MAWMQVQADDPSLSRWLLATEQFGRTWEFSWLAKNLAPVKFQKVRTTMLQALPYTLRATLLRHCERSTTDVRCAGVQIHWRSVPGSSTMGNALDIANRGQIRFRKISADSCVIKLTISYEVPDILAPFAGVRSSRALQHLIDLC